MSQSSVPEPRVLLSNLAYVESPRWHGGPHRRTLFMLAADWRGIENVDDAIARRTGHVLVTEAPAPAVGWP